MNINDYTNLLNKYDIHRSKCKCCGNDIFYDGTSAKYWGDKIVIKGKSYRTIKKVNGVDYQLKVCQACLLSKYPSIKNLNRTFNVMSEQTMFAFDIPQEVFDNVRSKYAMTKKHMIEKYGEGEGLKKWDEYCKKQAETNTYEYKQSKYGWTEEQFKKYNESRAVTLENLIRRHGGEEGLKKWKSYCERQSKTKTKDYILSTYGEEELNRILNDRRKGMKSPKNYSKESQKFFDELDKILGEKYHTYYKTKNYEYDIKYNYNCYFLDYYIEELKLCIEFNGDFWHANPKLYKPDDILNLLDHRITAKELWDKDFERIKILENKFNINTVIVWESDYKKGIDIKDFIKNTLNIQL